MSIMRDSTMTLYGAVRTDDLDDLSGFSARDVRTALDNHGAGDIIVCLNSPGGNAFEGLAIYNALKSHHGKVTINIDGVAASAASLIAMAGDEIVMLSGAMIMIHDPRSVTVGTSAAHRKVADDLELMARQFGEIYAERTGQTPQAIAEMMAAETWCDADKAIASGFATRKAETKSARIFADFDYSQYGNAPKFLMQMKKGPTAMPNTTDGDIANDFLNAKPWAGRFYRSAGTSDLSIGVLNDIVEMSATYDDARDELVAAMAASTNANKPSPQSRSPYGLGAGNTFGNPNFLAKTIGDVLHARMSGAAPEGAARELMGCSILELGSRLAEVNGQRISWSSRGEVVDNIMMTAGGHSTSDFSQLLLGAGNRVFLDAYKLAESPLKGLGKRRDAADFRPLMSIRLSEAPALLEKPEGGELTYGSRSETVESFALKPAGRIFAITREALINDDLGAFSSSARAWGRTAALYEADRLYSLFSANGGAGATLSDNNALYTTARGNKLTVGSALASGSLSSARQSMRSMKDPDGKTFINLKPRHLVVGPSLEETALQLAATITPTAINDVNTFAGKLDVHVEPRFQDATWRIFADPSDLPVIVYGYLNGQAGPQLATKEGWTTLGMEFRCVLDFGCGLEDWRGSVMATGEAPAE
ncbi:MAG: Clp protease ClpP [Pseudolabrys sp.]|nr:Clp protease ClpP [Pseudolabrys sp.]